NANVTDEVPLVPVAREEAAPTEAAAPADSGEMKSILKRPGTLPKTSAAPMPLNPDSQQPTEAPAAEENQEPSSVPPPMIRPVGAKPLSPISAREAEQNVAEQAE